MSDPIDLRGLLDQWPYDPEASVRLLQAPDGRPVMQVRLPMGIEQYELKGRPDGQRPYRKESVFEYHLERYNQARAASDAGSFRLSPEDCAELFQEGMLFYHRYLHLFEAKQWQGTVRDTARNLKVFDFVHRHAEREEDQNYLEQWRPYILRIHATARAMIELGNRGYAKAMEIVNDAIHKIEALPAIPQETFRFEQQRSLLALRDLLGQIESHRPLSELQRLEQALQRAVAAQEFERAAELRDRIRALRGQTA